MSFLLSVHLRRLSIITLTPFLRRQAHGVAGKVLRVLGPEDQVTSQKASKGKAGFQKGVYSWLIKA